MLLDEDPFNTTLFRAVQFDVDIGEDALGLYDVTVTVKTGASADESKGEVDGFVMREAVNVVKIEFEDDDGNPVEMIPLISAVRLEEIMKFETQMTPAVPITESYAFIEGVDPFPPFFGDN